MATEIILKVDGNFLLVTDDSNGNVSNFPLSSTSYEIFTPKEVDAISPDNKTYLFLTNLDGSKRKTGGWDIFCENNNYYFSLDGVGNFATLQDLTDYLDDNLASTLSYKSYTALWSQNSLGGVNVLAELENTIGVVNITPSGLGAIVIDFDGVVFPENKVIGMCYSGGDAEDGYVHWIVKNQETQIKIESVDSITSEQINIRVDIKYYN